MPTADLFKHCNQLRNQGRTGEALDLLRSALRRDELSAVEIDKAGRFIQREHAGRADVHRVRVLGQCTTTWLASALAAHAWRIGTPAAVVDGAYDSVLQELLAAADTGQTIDTVVLLPWHQRLLAGEGRSAEQRLGDELAFWRQAWSIVTDRLKARLIQVGYDTADAGPDGLACSFKDDGPTGLTQRMNRVLADALPRGAYYVDLGRIAGEMGRDAFYDPRRYHWTKQPFSEAGASLLGRHLAAGLRAVTTGPKKVLVLDLDNTLWGGVVGETGPLGITLGETPDGEAFRAFQQYCKGLSRRGVVLAVCSKNNADDAREPFTRHPDTVLSLDDFAAFEAGWDPKPVAIQRIAQALRLGLDSFVFFDDNPAEREHVRQALPEVEVVEVPDDPSSYVRALGSGLWFESVSISRDDLQRAEQYTTERRRREAQQAYDSVDAYLGSLELVADVRVIDDADLPRVVQLLGKTNQFNLTTRRHTEPDVRALLDRPGAVGLTMRLSDKFGDHGLVSVLIAVPEDDAGLRIDTWLMSCRVISRTAEQYLFNVLLDHVRGQGAEHLVGEYLPTAKNPLVADLYDRLGFERVAEAPDGSVRYRLGVDTAAPADTFIQPARALHR